ncbi:hypothetical protein CF15_05150 [Pyrodictium occultum]|uniref:Lipoyl-binding domain-containing protein n=1 Tax=Pyrodictium occultum TaxID=2309 RepID=A0A0V8RVV8_PYROC|nr:acetyl-CoA carboxylase biotin carboxyl carrier protein subunit [Pyrodictium occultum]KSW12152.1 hypothetical protein CF15_05150 [Pyrodictium occultum]
MDGPGRPGARLLEIRETAPGVYEARLEVGGRVLTVRARLVGDVLETPYGSYHLPSLLSRGHAAGAQRGRRREEWLVQLDAGGVLRAKLPVKVVEVRVRPGDRVEEGQVIVILETMKMVNEVHSPCRGVVEEVAEPGRGLARGEPLARIKCLGEG